MRSEVVVSFPAGREFRLDLDPARAMAPDAARAWLDQQFVRLECEPLRATGKVLTADKLIAIAQAAGPELFGDAAWAAEFAQAAAGALAKPVVRIDLNAMTVGY